MSESRSCMLLLLSAIAGFLPVSVAKIPLKYAYPGDSVQVFQNIEFNNCDAAVSLWKVDDINITILAEWSIQNCNRNESIIPVYHGRLSFDQKGTITIRNIDHFDEALYIVKSKMDPLPQIKEIRLMVVPTNDSNPIIEKLENSRIACLNANDSGRPVAKPYWKDYDGVCNTFQNESVRKITPGMEVTKYCACITDAAITCLKNVTKYDYCTTFPTEECKSQPASFETCSAHLTVWIILGIFLIAAIILIAFLLYRYCHKKKAVKDKNTIGLLEKKKIEELNTEEIIQLLNEDQQRNLQAYFENLKSQKDNPCPDNDKECDVENDKE